MWGWCRPLRVLVEDCRVMIDVEARNAIIAMVMHLISAFKMPARPRTPQACHLLISRSLCVFRDYMLTLLMKGWCM